MNDVRLDPQQAPARAELLLAADFEQEARGRPIHGRPESEGADDAEPGPRLKVGAVRTRRLAVSETAARPSGSVYGNPLRGTRDNAPTVPIGAPVIVRTDIPDAHGWRVYRVAPNGAVICDGWIEHDPAHAERALTELRAAAATSPAAALRRPEAARPRERGGDHAVARRPGDRTARRPGETPVAGGPAAVAARPHAERRPRMTSTSIPPGPIPALLAVFLSQNALMTTAHADTSRPVPIRCAFRHRPAWTAGRPSTPTTRPDHP